MASRASKNLANNLARIGKGVMSVGRDLASLVTAPISGYIADVKRGNVLWGEGYGHTYDSATDIAKAGKSGFFKGRRRTTKE